MVGTMRMRTPITAAAAAALMFSSGTAVAVRGPVSRHAAAGPGGSLSTGAARRERPGQADWQRIKAAAHLRDLALEPHRTAHFRAFSAFLGLSELVTIHPLGPGRCATAVIYLYDNLLDLHDATPGENWTPLRRLVAKEPSINACAPRERRRVGP